jgi:hypothetical protein
MVCSGMLMTALENAGVAAESHDLLATTGEALRQWIGRDIAEGRTTCSEGGHCAVAVRHFCHAGPLLHALGAAAAEDLTSVAATATSAWPMHQDAEFQTAAPEMARRRMASDAASVGAPLPPGRSGAVSCRTTCRKRRIPLIPRASRGS